MIDRTVTSPSCQKKPDGSVSINNIYKGYPPYTSFLNNLAPVNNNFNNLSDGSYVLKVIDRYGCNLIDTIQLVEPPLTWLTSEMTCILYSDRRSYCMPLQPYLRYPGSFGLKARSYVIFPVMEIHIYPIRLPRSSGWPGQNGDAWLQIVSR